jgi:hypothetical protein
MPPSGAYARKARWTRQRRRPCVLRSRPLLPPLEAAGPPAAFLAGLGSAHHNPAAMAARATNSAKAGGTASASSAPDIQLICMASRPCCTPEKFPMQCTMSLFPRRPTHRARRAVVLGVRRRGDRERSFEIPVPVGLQVEHRAAEHNRVGQRRAANTSKNFANIFRNILWIAPRSEFGTAAEPIVKKLESQEAKYCHAYLSPTLRRIARWRARPSRCAHRQERTPCIGRFAAAIGVWSQAAGVAEALGASESRAAFYFLASWRGG